MLDKSTPTEPVELVTAVVVVEDIQLLKPLMAMVPSTSRAPGGQAGVVTSVMVITEGEGAVTPIYISGTASRSAEGFQLMARILW